MSLLFVDHQMLSKLVSSKKEFFGDDKAEAFHDLIREKVYNLEDQHKQAIVMHYFENLNLTDIAGEMGLEENQVHKLLGEALSILKYVLADIVENRWPDRFKNLHLCPVCNHPEKKKIEKIISGKRNKDSWGKINSQLNKHVGETFHPPSILINHLKYHMKG